MPSSLFQSVFWLIGLAPVGAATTLRSPPNIVTEQPDRFSAVGSELLTANFWPNFIAGDSAAANHNPDRAARQLARRDPR
jgi:hypothetical protein